MPRQARLDAPGTLHQVMIRGIERSPIFKSGEFGVSRAEIARQLGVCTSSIAKAIQNVEAEENKC